MDFCRIDDGTFLGYPTDRVTAVLPTEADVASAVKRLSDAGLPRDQIEVLCGAPAADMIDADGDDHGNLTQMMRFVQRFTDQDVAQSKRHEQELKDGRYLLFAPAESREIALKIAALLQESNAYFISYFGTFAVEQIAE